jgi:hypothetical protein
VLLHGVTSEFDLALRVLLLYAVKVKSVKPVLSLPFSLCIRHWPAKSSSTVTFTILRYCAHSPGFYCAIIHLAQAYSLSYPHHPSSTLALNFTHTKLTGTRYSLLTKTQRNSQNESQSHPQAPATRGHGRSETHIRFRRASVTPPSSQHTHAGRHV